MGKLSAFWVAGIAASLGASAASAVPVANELKNLRLHPLTQSQFAAATAAQKQIAPFRMNAAQKRSAGYAKMDNALARIAQATATTPREKLMGALNATFPKARFAQQIPLATPLVLVNMHVEGDRNAAKQQLAALGAQHVSIFKNLMSAFIPADRLKDAAAIGDVRAMRLSLSTANTGSVTAQGDIIQSSIALRNPLAVPGYSGAGYTVGVLSDSFACVSAPQPPAGAPPTVTPGYATDVYTGDLPNVNVLSEYNNGDPTSPCDGGTDEGRAMAQLVYDIAPGVNLAFHTAFNGEADFAQGIVDLADPTKGNAQIIVDDVFYFDEPVFQDGVVAQAVQQVHDAGVAYFSSAGNDARQSYEADWVDSGVQGQAGDDNEGQELMAFQTPAGSPLPPFILPAFNPYPGLTTYVVLEWDQPYVTGAPNSGGATSSLNVCLVDISPDPGYGHVYPGSCSGANLLGEDPIAITGISNPTDGPIEYGIEISMADGTAPNHLKVLFIDDGAGSNAVPGYATYSGTIFGHAAAAGAAAVGASYFRYNPICNAASYPTFVLESYSSSGGDPILFDATGAPLATPEQRQKPQFVAPDGDNTTFFSFQLGERDSDVPGCSNSPTAWNFFGTSSAAPHAAGMAALLWEAGPDMTNDQVVATMENTAVIQMISLDWSTFSLDPPANPTPILVDTVNYDTGYGFIQGAYALPAAQFKAVAGSPVTIVPQGHKVTLDGSASLIPQGATPASYIWTQVAGPTVKLANANSANPTFNAVQPNTYGFVLSIALDNGRVSAPSSPVSVTVTGGPGPGGGGAIGLGLLIPGFMAAALRRRRKS